MGVERRLVVISPHYDDGVFSCGEALAGAPGALVITLFGGFPPAPARLTAWDAACGFTAADDVVARRRDEDRRALRRLGARPLWLPFRDSQYEESPGLPAGLVDALGAAIARATPTCVLAPLGLFHDDHRMAHTAALTVRRELPHLRWVAYEDAIYRRRRGLVDDQLEALRRAGIAPRRVAVGARRFPAAKRDAALCYASQLRALSLPGYPGYGDVFRPEAFWSL